MATEEINYRVDIKDPGDERWTPWFAPLDLGGAKREQMAIWNDPKHPRRDARIVETKTTHTETMLRVDAANLTILSREEI